MGFRTRLAAPFLVRQLPPAPHPAVLLTFDDGPSPEVTEAVLERLAHHGARAVFCLVGRRVDKAPRLVRDLVAAGHVPANHSHEHRMAAWPSLGAYQDDLDRCSAAIESAAGVSPRAFRAPGGRIHPASLLAPRRRRLPHLHWSLDPRDYACTSHEHAAAVGEDLARTVRPRDIILLHDDHPHVLPLLDVLLPRLAGAGFDLAGGVAQLGLTGDRP